MSRQRESYFKVLARAFCRVCVKESVGKERRASVGECAGDNMFREWVCVAFERYKYFTVLTEGCAKKNQNTKSVFIKKKNEPAIEMEMNKSRINTKNGSRHTLVARNL